MKINFDAPPGSAQQSNGLAVRYAAAKREVPRWRWYLMLALVGVPLAYFALRLAAGAWWQAAPGVVVMPTATVRAALTGQVLRVEAPGTGVAVGGALMTVRLPGVLGEAGGGPATPATSAAGAARGVEGRAGTSAPALGGDARSLAPQGTVADESLRLLGQAVRIAERQVAFRRQRLAVVEGLRREGAATRAEADAARAAAVQAEADVLRARADVEARRLALRDEARAAQRAAAAIAAAGGATPPAPASGLPPQPGAVSPLEGTIAQVFVAEGEFVTAGSDVATVFGRAPPSVEAYVAPGDSRYARAGRRATLIFFDGTRVPARVVGVRPQVARVPAERVGPLSPRTTSMIVELQPEVPLPQAHRIHQLPLDVRFDHLWPWST
jgi:HlyD family secretion protein